MTIEEMRKRKEEQKLTYKEISRRSGIPLPTVQKILGGSTQSPRYKTIQALEAVLGDSSVYDPLDNKSSSGILRESQAVYGKTSFRSYPLLPDKLQGEYTAADLARIPEDIRVELIDGVIYDMASPTGFHQIIAGHLYSILLTAIQAKKGSCMPFMSPIDVRLDLDDRTMVQPDVIILCDKSKYTPRRIEGAPDFIAEVLSPSSKTRDLFIKLNKYRNAGVREYWVIDPIKKSVMTYVFENQDDYAYYTFRDHIPVSIYGDELVIDFSRIDDVVSEWM